ncbi:hypothetical protein ASG73_15670 [Janibacter sp. Soil728]|uniref:hypothetical protein n=1 Tax=Janibacter sp. Soil728 TaxID=1736393 RepID=UPI0006F4150F|nr:hypothetical protein [Janibacter sp. Soil728]KRE36089.1 hypothetical protein ASG73_15670 [Janibacter sp. Soil728]
MGLDHRLSFLLQQLAWDLPVILITVVAGVLVVLRRDGGLWWKLALVGLVAITAGQLVGTFGFFAVSGLDGGYRYSWVASVPALVLNLAGLGLLAAGAIVGRRGQVAAR